VRVLGKRLPVKQQQQQKQIQKQKQSEMAKNSCGCCFVGEKMLLRNGTPNGSEVTEKEMFKKKITKPKKMFLQI
jgi:hypothetical protein